VSLRLRLALWYGGLTGLVVLVVSLLAYAEHTRITTMLIAHWSGRSSM
jgi:hypothetical protein